jgi:lysozyme
MTTAERATLREQLIRHEGLKLRPYRCPAGRLTIGVGRNLQDRGISSSEALYLLDNDIAEIELDLRSRLLVFPELTPVRQRVLIDMAFNLGTAGLFGFRKMLAAITAHDYEAAARHGLNSAWAKQVGTRATRLMAMLETGVDVA